MALYHYTTETRHNQILESGVLQPSTNTQTDAAFGEGWYFTDLGPTTCEKVLMKYCWERLTLFQRVKYYFRLQPVGAVAEWRKPYVYFVPLRANVSFTILENGPIPDCSLKPCSTCLRNPER